MQQQPRLCLAHDFTSCHRHCDRRYKDALDAALQTKRPDVVCSVLEELAGRGGLQRALGNRDAEALLPLLGFLAKYIAEPRHSRLLTDVSHRWAARAVIL